MEKLNEYLLTANEGEIPFIEVYNSRIQSLYETMVNIITKITSEDNIKDYVERALEIEQSEYIERIMRELAYTKAEQKKIEQADKKILTTIDMNTEEKGCVKSEEINKLRSEVNISNIEIIKLKEKLKENKEQIINLVNIDSGLNKTSNVNISLNEVRDSVQNNEAFTILNERSEEQLEDEELSILILNLGKLITVLREKEAKLSKKRREENELKTNYERIIGELKEEMKKVKDNCKHQVYTRELEFQREISSIKSKHALDLARHNEDWEQICEQRLIEMEKSFRVEQSNASNRLEVSYRSQLEEFKETTISLQEYKTSIEILKGDLKDKEREVTELNASHKEVLVDLNNKYDLKVKELGDKVKSLLVENTELESKNLKFVKELNERWEEIEISTKNYNELKDKCKEGDIILQTAKDELIETKELLAKVYKERESLEIEINSIKDNRDRLLIKCKVLENEIEEYGVKYNKKLEDYSLEVKLLEDTITEKNQEIEHLHKNLKEVRETDCKSIEIETNKYTETMAKLVVEQESTRNLKLQLERVTTKLSQAENSKEQLQTKLQDVEDKINDKSKEIQIFKYKLNEVVELQENVKEYISTRLKELNEYILDIKNNIENLNDLVGKKCKQAISDITDYYKNIIQRKDGNINELKDTLKEILKKAEEDNTNNEAKENHLKALQEIELNKLRNELESQSTILNDNIMKLEKQLREKEVIINEYRKINEELNRNIDSIKGEYDKYKNMVDEHKDEIYKKLKEKKTQILKVKEQYSRELDHLYKNIGEFKNESIQLIRRILISLKQKPEKVRPKVIIAKEDTQEPKQLVKSTINNYNQIRLAGKTVINNLQNEIKKLRSDILGVKDNRQKDYFIHYDSKSNNKYIKDLKRTISK